MDEDGSSELGTDWAILDAASSSTSSSGRKFDYIRIGISTGKIDKAANARTDSRQRRIWIKRKVTSIGVIVSILPSVSSGVSSDWLG